MFVELRMNRYNNNAGQLKGLSFLTSAIIFVSHSVFLHAIKFRTTAWNAWKIQLQVYLSIKAWWSLNKKKKNLFKVIGVETVPRLLICMCVELSSIVSAELRMMIHEIILYSCLFVCIYIYISFVTQPISSRRFRKHLPRLCVNFTGRQETPTDNIAESITLLDSVQWD